MTRKQKRACRARSWVTFLIFLSISWLGAIRSSQSAPEESDDEVFLDWQTKEFQAPLRAKDLESPVNVVLHLEPKSHVVISYWLKDGKKDCPKEPPDGAVRRSGAPGAKVGDLQKYVAKVGPLDILEKYCFQVEISRYRDLVETEKKEIIRALRAVVENLVKTSTCNKSGTADVGTPCFAEKFIEALPAWKDGPKVKTDTGAQEQTLEEAFKELLDASALLRSKLSDAMQQAGREKTNLEALEKFLGSFHEAVNDWKDDDVASVDPLCFVQKPDAIVDRLNTRNKNGKSLLNDARNSNLTDRGKFFEWVWTHREDLAKVGADKKTHVRRPLTDTESEDLLMGLLKRGDRDKPVFFHATKQQVVSLFDTLGRSRESPTEVISAINGWVAGAKLPEKIEKPAELPSSCEPAFKRSMRLRNDLNKLKSLAQGVLDARKDYESLINSPEFNSFLADVEALQVVRPDIGQIHPTAKFEQRFPLSVAADVGIGFVSFRKDSWNMDAFSYFALAIYLAPVYKYRPLEGREVLRRFSVVAGLAIHRPDPGSQYGVSGLLGNQMLLTGAGLRLTDYVRLSGGLLWYEQQPPGDLSSTSKTRVAPYLAVSLDLDVIGTVAGWYKSATTSLR